MVSAQADKDVRYSHIPGSKNEIADVLSRWQNMKAQYKLVHSRVDTSKHYMLHIDDEISKFVDRFYTLFQVEDICKF